MGKTFQRRPDFIAGLMCLASCVPSSLLVGNSNLAIAKMQSELFRGNLEKKTHCLRPKEGRCSVTIECIGIDIGSNIIGWAVVDGDGNLRDCGAKTFSSEAKGFDGLAERLCQARSFCDDFFAAMSDPLGSGYDVLVGVEEPHLSKNRHTALTLGMVFGIVVSSAESCCLSTRRFTPGQAKKALTGNGNATKAEVLAAARVQGMVYTGVGEQDAADAYGVALAARLAHIEEKLASG